jgi:hypothetical protein
MRLDEAGHINADDFDDTDPAYDPRISERKRQELVDLKIVVTEPQPVSRTETVEQMQAQRRKRREIDRVGLVPAHIRERNDQICSETDAVAAEAIAGVEAHIPAGPRGRHRRIGLYLEVRNVDGRLHVARKERRHDEWDPPIAPYDPYGPGDVSDDELAAVTRDTGVTRDD